MKFLAFEGRLTLRIETIELSVFYHEVIFIFSDELMKCSMANERLKACICNEKSTFFCQFNRMCSVIWESCE